MPSIVSTGEYAIYYIGMAAITLVGLGVFLWALISKKTK